jgi:hypothetical protein
VAFSLEARAQSKIRVDTSTSAPAGDKNEPSIAVQPWDASGNTLAASWQYAPSLGSGLPPDDKTTYTSFSTNGGALWTSNGSISVPTGSGTFCSTTPSYSYTADARLSYRKNSSSQDQLVCVFRAYNDWNAGYPRFEGTFVGFSTNNGNSWPVETPIETNSVCSNSNPDVQTIRPYVVSDNISTGSLLNNTYVCWTHWNELVGNTTSIEFGTILPSSNTISTPITIASGSSSSPTFDTVEALALAVSSHGTVYLLYRQLNAGVSPETFDLFITFSTTGGGLGSWSTPMQINTADLEIPTFRFAYQDYPVMTISGSGSTETIFVAYTKGMGSSSTNPSDLYITSSPVSSLSWSTPTLIDADDLVITPPSSNTNQYTFQYQPSICPDGNGGVYLLYYTQQVTGGPHLPLQEVPVLYETPGPCDLGQHRQISAPIPAFLFGGEDGLGVGDYVGVAYNSAKGTVHPIWTDSNTVVLDPNFKKHSIYTLAISKPLAGVTNYNNQRKVAGDASQLHWVVEQDVGATHQITYRRTESAHPENLLVPDYTFPNPAVAPNPTPTPPTPGCPNGFVRREPSIAIYSMPGTLDPNNKWICAVWESYPNNPDFTAVDKVIEYALANSTNGGTTWNWLNGGTPFQYWLKQSVLTGGDLIASDESDPTDSKNYEITPVVAPVIHAATYGTTQCMGFRIFWANGSNQIRSIAIDLTGTVKFSEFAVSEAISAERPSCVSSFWYNPTDPNYTLIWDDNGSNDYESIFDPTTEGYDYPPITLGNGDYQGSALDEKVHVVWEEDDASHAAGIMATEVYSDFNDLSTWLVIGHNWTLDNYSDGCPPFILTQEDQTYWDLTGLAESSTVTFGPNPNDCTAFMFDDSHDPCISLDEYGRQRVTWRLNGTCQDNDEQYSAIITLMGGPVTTQVCESAGTCEIGSYYQACCCNETWLSCPQLPPAYCDEGYVTYDGGLTWMHITTDCGNTWLCCTYSSVSYQGVCNPPAWVSYGSTPSGSTPIYGWRNSYANPVFWCWNTPNFASDGTNLTFSPTITGATLDPSTTTDNVEVVWLTNEGSIGTTTRVADDIDDDGNFSYSSGELSQPLYGTLTGPPSPLYRNGVDNPNSAMGNSLARTNSGFAYHMTCSSNDVVGFGSVNFNPSDPLFKMAEGSADQSATYSAQGKFSCQLSGLTVSGIMKSNLLRSISTEKEISGSFHLAAGESFTVNLFARSMDSGYQTKLVIEHSDGSKEVLVPLVCKRTCAEVLKYTSPIDDNCKLALETNTFGVVLSSGFSAPTALPQLDTVFLGSMPGSPVSEGALSILDNPFSNQLKIQTTIPRNFPADLRVYNTLGAIMATILADETTTESFEYVLNTQDWPNGAYFVRLEIGNGVIAKRIVKIQ